MTDAISKLTQLLDDYVDERIAESSSNRPPEMESISELKARQFVTALLEAMQEQVSKK